jgi:DNA-binding transcriptional MocR family regulator
VRVCFAFLTADEIEEGVRRLAKAVRSVAAEAAVARRDRGE